MFKRLLLSICLSLGIFQLTFAQDQNSVTNSENEEKGYFQSYELNYNNSILYNYKFRLAGIQTTQGFKFNKHISTGLGIGVEQEVFKSFQENRFETGNIYLPAFTDVKIFLGKGKGKTKPFISQIVGYAFCIYQKGYDKQNGYNKQLGGILANPNIGAQIKLAPKVAWNISLGYRFQEFTIKNVYFHNDVNGLVYYNGNSFKFSTNSNYLTFKTGLTF